MMKIKKLDLWEINKQAFKVWDKFTSVLSQRAGIKSKLFPILYSSREQSLERITTSPGVSRILNKNSIEEKSNKGKIDYYFLIIMLNRNNYFAVI